jgi:hypothetical protein
VVAVTTNPGDLLLCALIAAGIGTQLWAGRRRYQRPEARHRRAMRALGRAAGQDRARHTQRVP